MFAKTYCIVSQLHVNRRALLVAYPVCEQVAPGGAPVEVEEVMLVDVHEPSSFS